MRGRRWVLDTTGADLRVELVDFPSGDRTAIQQSEREVDALLSRALDARDAGARRVLEEVYGDLRGTGHALRQARRTRGPSFEHALSDELRFAAYSGLLKVERVARVRVVPPPVVDAVESVLGPDASSTHVYKLCVVDDTGAPVAGVKLSLDIDGDKQDKTTDGSGKITVEKPNPGTATVTITNLDDVRDKLWSQWAKPLADKAPAGDQITQAAIMQPIPPLKAPSDWLVTLVLQRPPIWRVRMVGMIFDGDKSFLLPQALDGIRSIVAMHQAHPAAKVLVVGHEGGDEVTGGVDLALGRAKIVAGYLTSKPDDWMDWFGSDKAARQRWGVREVQLMLSAVNGADGTPYYDGSSPGVMDDKTAAALKAFQGANGLPTDGKAGASTRQALVKKYMALEDTSLAADVQPVAHGCTGHEDDTMTQDGLQPDDRRLEVLFFEGTEIKPPPSGDTSDGGSPEYPAWKARLVETVDFENHGIHVQLVDTQKQPVPLATVHLDGPTQEDTVADEHGFVTFWGLVAGDYTVTGTSRTGIPLPTMKVTYPTAKTVEGARALPSKGGGAT
jgi:outer membrane protein OmpA-like peptidoglycan-associated protein